MKAKKSNLYSPQYNKSILNVDATLRDALKAISESGLLIACILDTNEKIVGILTDSDIRRAMLAGASLDDCANKWSNQAPMVCSVSDQTSVLISLAYETGKTVIPLVNSDNQLVDIFIFNQVCQSVDNQPLNSSRSSENFENNWVFILAGGLGSRLKPAVSDRPKPLALVGDKPIIQTVIHHIAGCGFKNFIVSLNYRADLIKEHLSSEFYKSLTIKTLLEPKRLGTAGSIGYISKQICEPLVVCNADVLTTAPYDKVLEHHKKESADITCVVRPFRLTVPYGVADIYEGKIKSIREKPESQFIVSAGIYVLSPEICLQIEEGKYLDMPDLVGQAIEAGKKVIPFLAHEYWIDVGRPEDYLRANDEYMQYFINNSKLL